MLGANWVLPCLLVPGAKCGRAAALQCPATNYRGQLAVCRHDGGGYGISAELWIVWLLATPTDILIG